MALDRMARGTGSLSLRTLLPALALAIAVGSAPAPASADATQLCRAGMNMILAPLDIVMAPYIAGKDEYYGLTEIDDEMALKAVAAAPGYVFLLGMQVGGAIIREIGGVFEIIPGIMTLFRDEPGPALFRSGEDAWAVYADEFGPCPVKVGISYNTINDG